MNEDYIETNSIDLSFEIDSLILAALESTLEKSVGEIVEKFKIENISIEKIKSNLITSAFERLEDDCYLTTGSNGKIYLAGTWLMVDVNIDNKFLPIYFHFDARFDRDQVIMHPEMSGIELRKKLWASRNEEIPSYGLPKYGRLQDPLRVKYRMFAPYKQNKTVAKPVTPEKNSAPSQTHKFLNDLLHELDDFENVTELEEIEELEELEELEDVEKSATNAQAQEKNAGKNLQRLQGISDIHKLALEQLVDKMLEP